MSAAQRWGGVEDGDESIAFELEHLIGRHGGRLGQVVARVLGDPAAAEDVCQETWMVLWRERAAGRVVDEEAWPFLRRVGVRKAIDELRRRRRQPATGLRTEPEGEESPAPDLSAALETLPPSERSVLVLFFWSGCSVKEIAEALDVPTGTVKTWMHRGRQRLKVVLERSRES